MGKSQYMNREMHKCMKGVSKLSNLQGLKSSNNFISGFWLLSKINVVCGNCIVAMAIPVVHFSVEWYKIKKGLTAHATTPILKIQ